MIKKYIILFVLMMSLLYSEGGEIIFTYRTEYMGYSYPNDIKIKGYIKPYSSLEDILNKFPYDGIEIILYKDKSLKYIEVKKTLLNLEKKQ